ncbi:acyltransferase family protein [Nocardia sp. NBC_01377]|uniref:acyltransferase family protein n=1 Tax=Nocardia sp. NBC_01377 TaxID=2903595 RepID=UPI00324B6379
MTGDPATEEQRRARLPWIDATRAILMFLGIPFHAAFVYHGLPWYSGDGIHPVVSAVAGFVHTFRMPAFFTIAGYFAISALRRHDARAWTAQRARRLLVPFAAGVLVLGPPQLWLIASTTGPHADTAERWRGLLAQPSLWVFQLWFLMNLFLYGLALAAPFARFGRERVLARVEHLLGWVTAARHREAAILLTAGLLVAAGWAATVVTGLDNVAFGLVNLQLLVIYAPSFVVGVALGSRPELLRRFERCPPSHGLAWCAAASASAALAERGGALASCAHHLLVPVVGAGMTAVVFTTMRGLASGVNAVAARAADAAMVVYVFHNSLILSIAYLLLEPALPPLIEYAVIIVGALSGSLVVYAVVSRVPVLSWLFDGRRTTRGPFGARERRMRD